MEGRWTIARLPDCDIVQGPRTDGAVPVVPCDDAAVERAALAIAQEAGHASTASYARRLAQAALRAAGETPAPKSDYVCPQCGPAPEGPDAHADRMHTWPPGSDA